MTCRDFRPDHNGECVNCDGLADTHGLRARLHEARRLLGDPATTTPPPAALDQARGIIADVLCDERFTQMLARLRYEMETGLDWHAAPADPGLDPRWRPR